MSLRLRLLLMIGVSLSALWAATAAWMLGDLDARMRSTLDQRLAMSARMVAGLISQNPAAWESAARPGIATLAMPAAGQGLACQVSSLRGEVLARTPEALPEVMAAASGGYSEVAMHGERWRTYAFETPRFRVTTADRLAEREGLLRDVALAAALPFLVALFGSLLVLWLAVRRGLRPLEGLADELDRRAPDALAPIPAAEMPAELRPLVATLDRLFERVALAISRERRFTSDAAHELRTPLTGIITNLQVARITRGPDAEEALRHAAEASARLRHILEQLLTLSKVEGPFAWQDGSVARAGEVARQASRDTGAAPERLVVEGDGDEAPLAVPQALAVIALRNLLDNALGHSPAASPVSLEVRIDANEVRYCVSDRGPGMDDGQIELATRRFWRRGPGPGSGLGLSIVNAIAARFAGRFTLERREGGGMQATLVLPRAGEP